MGWQLTVHTVPMASAALISFTLAVIAFRSRDQRTALPLCGVLFGAGIWCATTALHVSSTTLGAKTFWHNVRFLGPTIVSPSIFLFAAEFTNREQWVSLRRLGLLAVPELLINVVAWTNPFHRLLRANVTLTEDPGFVAMDITYGPLFWAEAGYHYVLILATTYWIAMEFLRARKSGTEMYRTQAGLVLSATLVPWAANIAFVGGLTVVDLTPIAFVVTGLLFGAGLFHYRLLDLVPIARGTVVENMDSGVLVVDNDDVIVDLNPQARRIIEADREALVGTTVNKVFAEFPAIIRKFADARDTHDQVRIVRDGREEHYDVEVSPLEDSVGRVIGRVIVFSDITDRVERSEKLQERTEELERQNERLDEFASVVSHDLRNPLNVAQGQLMLGQEQIPDDAGAEHFELVEDSLDRMQTIIEDVLAIARQGQTVTDREEIDLEAFAREAWQSIAAPEATLTVTGTRTIAGDRERLRQVFENLFRNALDHGDPDATITVGPLDDGFYVEDDGPGIPAEEREKVFEKGYTTAEDGTGFGLALVETAIEAHGWSLTLTESDAGGARFEIADVDARHRAEEGAESTTDERQEPQAGSRTDD